MTLKEKMQETSSGNLIFSSVGDRSKHKLYGWRPGRSNFDLWLCYYGDENGKYKQDADIYEQRKGSKWENFHYLIQKYPDRIKNYSCVFVVDDDIEMDPIKISSFLDLFREYQLALAQPAFSQDSHTIWDELRERPEYVLRYTNFIECGVMAFSKEALVLCRSVIADAISGNGLDWICANFFKTQKYKIAVIDKTACRHPYRSEPAMNISMSRSDQTEEGKRLMLKYHVSPKRIKIYSGVRRSSIGIFMLCQVKYFFHELKRALGFIGSKLAPFIRRSKKGR